MAQDQFPLEAIPAAPENTTSGNVLARMTQGLGYRYHWATKDLREEDLNYRPSAEASSTYETLGASLRLGGNDSQCRTINSKRAPSSKNTRGLYCITSSDISLVGGSK